MRKISDRKKRKCQLHIVSLVRKIHLTHRLLLSAVLLPSFTCLLIVFILSYTFFATIKKNESEHVGLTADMIYYNLNQYLNSLITPLNVLSTKTSLVSAVSEYNTAVDTNDWTGYSREGADSIFTYYADNPDVFSIELVGMESSVAFFPNNITAGKRENSTFIQTLLESEERIVSFGNTPIENRVYSRPESRQIVIGVQVKSQLHGRVIGALFISLDPDKFFRQLTMGVQDSMYNIVVCTSENALVSTYFCDEELSGYKDELLAVPDNTKDVIAIGDTKYFAHQSMTDSLGWRILILTNYDKMVQNLMEKLYVCIVLCVLLTLLLLIVSVVVSRSVMIPVNELVNAMQKAELSSEPSCLQLTGSDELTYLTQNFNEMSQRINTLFVENLRANDQKRKIELDSLQAQINPHLLYNTLESVNWMAYLSGTNEICEIIHNLSTFYRLTLNQGKIYHSLSEELSQVECYLKLEQVIYSQAISYEIKMEGDFGTCIIPRIILQPIVENAILHGFNSSQLYILIHVYCLNQRMVISVYNNGAMIPGIGKEEVTAEDFNSQASSYGLSNINERIKLIYGEEFGVTLQNGENEGVFVRIYMPE